MPQSFFIRWLGTDLTCRMLNKKTKCTKQRQFFSFSQPAPVVLRDSIRLVRGTPYRDNADGSNLQRKVGLKKLF